MRGKRSKQYRKLMQQYGLHFGFREPYQVLLDAEILLEAAKCRMNFLKMLGQALHGQVKPMITQCSMRHLYESKNELVINHAQQFERRRCNHHTLEKPLTSFECLQGVVDSKGAGTNKHRYIVASQDQRVQEYMQLIPGVPLVYILRSVMIVKPMSSVTLQSREREEAAKFEQGLKGRRRNTETAGGTDSHKSIATSSADNEGSEPAKKKRKRGPAVPNSLASKPPSKAKQAERIRSAQESTGTTRRKRKKGLQSIDRETSPANAVAQQATDLAG